MALYRDLDLGDRIMAAVVVSVVIALVTGMVWIVWQTIAGSVPATAIGWFDPHAPFWHCSRFWDILGAPVFAALVFIYLSSVDLHGVLDAVQVHLDEPAFELLRIIVTSGTIVIGLLYVALDGFLWPLGTVLLVAGAIGCLGGSLLDPRRVTVRDRIATWQFLAFFWSAVVIVFIGFVPGLMLLVALSLGGFAGILGRELFRKKPTITWRMPLIGLPPTSPTEDAKPPAPVRKRRDPEASLAARLRKVKAREEALRLREMELSLREAALEQKRMDLGLPTDDEPSEKSPKET